jgi:hypothetical protein
MLVSRGVSCDPTRPGRASAQGSATRWNHGPLPTRAAGGFTVLTVSRIKQAAHRNFEQNRPFSASPRAVPGEAASHVKPHQRHRPAAAESERPAQHADRVRPDTDPAPSLK